MASFRYICLKMQMLANLTSPQFGPAIPPPVNRLEQVGVSSFRNSALAELYGLYPCAKFPN